MKNCGNGGDRGLLHLLLFDCKMDLTIPQWSLLQSGSQINDGNNCFCNDYFSICLLDWHVVFHPNSYGTALNKIAAVPLLFWSKHCHWSKQISNCHKLKKSIKKSIIWLPDQSECLWGIVWSILWLRANQLHTKGGGVGGRGKISTMWAGLA